MLIFANQKEYSQLHLSTKRVTRLIFVGQGNNIELTSMMGLWRHCGNKNNDVTDLGEVDKDFVTTELKHNDGENGGKIEIQNCFTSFVDDP